MGCGSSNDFARDVTPGKAAVSNVNSGSASSIERNSVSSSSTVQPLKTVPVVRPPTTIIEAIHSCVEELNLSHEAWPNEVPLGSIPEVIFSTLSLRVLILKQCGLLLLPPGISSLINLVTLDISENALREIPDGLGDCSNLEVLDCSSNELKSFPSLVFPKLHTLIAFKNVFSLLPDSLGECSSLRNLNVFNNSIIKLPAALSKLMALEDLNCASNKLKTLPKMDNWKKLKRLGAFWNTLVMLPTFEHLEDLEMLQLNDNQLEGFPKLGKHPRLADINCSGNRIEVLDAESFSRLESLTTLQLAKNKLKEIPNCIFKLPRFTLCNVSDCPLEHIPEEICNCSSLSVLFWAGTSTTSLPASLLQLKNLSRVDFTRNKLDDSALKLCKAMQFNVPTLIMQL